VVVIVRTWGAALLRPYEKAREGQDAGRQKGPPHAKSACGAPTHRFRGGGMKLLKLLMVALGRTTRCGKASPLKGVSYRVTFFFREAMRNDRTARRRRRPLQESDVSCGHGRNGQLRRDHHRGSGELMVARGEERSGVRAQAGVPVPREARWGSREEPGSPQRDYGLTFAWGKL
jgi:hypothetical protein